MPFLIKIDKAKWLEAAWLEADDVTGDALGDLRTRDNGLSAWWIPDDGSNLDRVVAALAATRHYFEKFDYALIGEDSTQVLHLQVKPSPGESADDEANANWHRDFVELSGSKVLGLARVVMRKSTKARVPLGRVKQLVRHGVEAHKLSLDRLKETLQTEL